MFEKIIDFNNAKFNNLWGGFSCECLVDDTNKIVSFYKDNGECILVNGNNAEDILDFVLSEYYENEDTIIEDGFSKWLEEHYTKHTGHCEEKKEMPLDIIRKELDKQYKIISNQKKEIKRLREKLEKSAKTNFELRKEIMKLKMI